MAISAAIRLVVGGPWNPLRVTGTSLPPNLLLLCKIIALAFLATGHFRILPDPFLPFVPGLDGSLSGDAFRLTLQIVSVFSALCLLFNRLPRLSAGVLGGCFLLAVTASRAYYGNNKTCCGLLLVLAALSDSRAPESFFRWQMALIYFGAALNKLLDPDWQSGLFFDYWAREKVRNALYILAADSLPSLVAGKLACWGAIFAEFAAAWFFSIEKYRLAILLNVAFQTSLALFTGTTFTLFFFAMQAANFAFITWPKELAAEPRPASRSVGWRFLGPAVDPDGIAAKLGASWLAALAYSPTIWLLFTFLIARPPSPEALWRRVVVSAMAFVFAPISIVLARRAIERTRSATARAEGHRIGEKASLLPDETEQHG